METPLEEHNKLVAKTIKNTQQTVLLPYWPDNVRGIANSILRSSLFGVIKKGERKSYTRELLAAQGGVEIRYTGIRLDQLDLSVWEYLIHIARSYPLGDKVTFSANNFLKVLGKTTGKMNHEWFKECIGRLKATAVEIKYNRKTYMGSLLQDCYWDDSSNQYVVILNPKIIILYDTYEWTKLEADARLALKGKPLALWLYGYYSSHAEPFPIKTATLYKLSGASHSELRFFKRDLIKACSKIMEVTNWKFEVKDDLVLCKK
jgi:hypothetical protein